MAEMDMKEKLRDWLEECGDTYPRATATFLIAKGVMVREWISVKDRLPETYDKEPDWSVTVLFRTTQGHIHSGYRNIGRPQKSFYDDDWTPPYWLDESENLSFEEDDVTHWMPLPPAPEDAK